MPPPPGLLSTLELTASQRRSCRIFCSVRAVRSTPPPGPTPTMISTFLTGFHAGCAAAAVALISTKAAIAVAWHSQSALCILRSVHIELRHCFERLFPYPAVVIRDPSMDNHALGEL